MGNYNANKKKTLSGYVSRILSVASSILAKQIIVKFNLLKDNLPVWVRNKCTVIPNGVDSKIFYPIEKNEARKKLKWDKNEKIILFFTN